MDKHRVRRLLCGLLLVGAGIGLLSGCGGQDDSVGPNASSEGVSGSFYYTGPRDKTPGSKKTIGRGKAAPGSDQAQPMGNQSAPSGNP